MENTVCTIVDIDNIVVEKRIRDDAGNVTELSHDIQENGLINPPLVTKDLKLIAGFRRLTALKQLGCKQIEVRIMDVKDALHELKLEISENEVRKNFTFSERMKYAKLLKEEYATAMKNNGGSNDPKGRMRDVIANEVDLSSTTLGRAEYIYNHASDDIIKALDDNELSINGAYKMLKKQKLNAEREAEELKQKLEKQAMDFDQERADAARRIEKYVRKAEELETDLSVVKRLGDPKLVKDLEQSRLRECEANTKLKTLEEELAKERKRNKALTEAQGYAQAVEEERDILLEKVSRLENEIDQHQNAFTTIEDAIMLVADVKPKFDSIAKYASITTVNQKTLETASEYVESLISKLSKLRDLIDSGVLTSA